jgi:hypothetical protein
MRMKLAALVVIVRAKLGEVEVTAESPRLMQRTFVRFFAALVLAALCSRGRPKPAGLSPDSALKPLLYRLSYGGWPWPTIARVRGV